MRINHGKTKDRASIGKIHLEHNHEHLIQDEPVDSIISKMVDLGEDELAKVREELRAKNKSAPKIAQKLKSVFNKTYAIRLVENLIAKEVL